VTFSGTSSSFQCKSPSMTFSGVYTVTVVFTTGSTYRASQQILYTANTNPAATSSSAIATVAYTPTGNSKRAESSPTACPFLDSFQTTACSVMSMTCSASGAEVLLSSCVLDPITGDYALKVSFVGSGTPTAAQMTTLFDNQLVNTQWSQIGIKFLSFVQTGTCTSSGCVCNPNYSGTDCSTLANCPNNCTQHGACVDGTYSRVCDCYEGYTGRDCSIFACPNDCSGHGSCVVTSTNGTCICDTGYEGDDCSAGSSACPNGCSGHGTCSAGVCVCDAGYTGAGCTTYGFITNPSTNSQSGGGLSPSTTAFAVIMAVVGFLVLVAIALGIALVIRNRRRRQ